MNPTNKQTKNQIRKKGLQYFEDIYNVSNGIFTPKSVFFAQKRTKTAKTQKHKVLIINA